MHRIWMNHLKRYFPEEGNPIDQFYLFVQSAKIPVPLLSDQTAEPGFLLRFYRVIGLESLNLYPFYLPVWEPIRLTRLKLYHLQRSTWTNSSSRYCVSPRLWWSYINPVFLDSSIVLIFEGVWCGLWVRKTIE